MHGDEPAPSLAAAAIARWQLRRGRLAVVPRANQPALKRSTRRAPRTRFADLNRNFPTAADEPALGTMATALWALVERLRPDWIVDLHEGFDFNRKNPRSVGSSVLFNALDGVEAQAVRLVAEVDRLVHDEQRRFTIIQRTAPGSLARAATERLGIRALILETTRQGESVEHRAAQHRAMVARLMQDLGMDPRPFPGSEGR
jgi:predicted deacylase